MPPSEGFATHWITELNAGNPRAAQELWDRYFRRIAALARRKLRGLPSAIADEEDVAVSAFRTFFRRAREGQFPQLRGGDDLWPLLVRITACKAFNLQRRERQAKRDARRNLPTGAGPTEQELVALIGAEPSEQFAGELVEEFRHLIGLLPDDELRRIAVLKLEGLETAAIAGKLDLHERQVQRRVKVIYALWRERLAP